MEEQAVARLDPGARRLYEEVHARPFPRITPPTSVRHLVTMTADADPDEIITHFYSLAGASAPEDPPKSNTLLLEGDGYTVRLERHREFCSYLFTWQNESPDGMLGRRRTVPADWLEGLPGRLMIHNSVKLIPDEYTEIDAAQVREHLENHTVTGARVMGGRATVWTSFRLHTDGSARYVVFVGNLTPAQTGQLLQLLVELETYRILALLGFPMARGMTGELARINTGLSALLEQLRHADTMEAEREILIDITELSASLEELQARSSFRFGATRAYHQLVNERLEALDEEPFGRVPMLSTFLGRRLGPAMRTVSAVQSEIQQISGRLSSATSLLQARVNLHLQEQNRTLLSSMDRRSRMQLRLQTTVEGLSVAAITYYSVGLLDRPYALMEQVGLVPSGRVLSALSVIPVAALVWFLIRRVRRRVEAEA
ncbi:MAG: DUF3422 family protein [Gammaproteobacteria bacterium]|jgi:uncharacterized membrane-anchored protein|nr:DUF3422 family protein [Gammaproteobacteria bacterium]